MNGNEMRCASQALSRAARVRKLLAASLAMTVVMAGASQVAAQEVDENITACLKAFGEHPFSADPKFKTLAVSVKVFGIGKDTVDDEITTSPQLVFIKPGVNVMGGSLIDLRNPQGWYCMRTSVNVMGGLDIKLACNAKFVIVSEETSVMSNSADSKGITVMGATTVERDCPK